MERGREQHDSILLGEDKQQRGCREEECAEWNCFKDKISIPQEIPNARGKKKIEKFLFQNGTWIFFLNLCFLNTVEEKRQRREIMKNKKSH